MYAGAYTSQHFKKIADILLKGKIHAWLHEHCSHKTTCQWSLMANLILPTGPGAEKAKRKTMLHVSGYKCYVNISIEMPFRRY